MADPIVADPSVPFIRDHLKRLREANTRLLAAIRLLRDDIADQAVPLLLDDVELLLSKLWEELYDAFEAAQKAAEPGEVGDRPEEIEPNAKARKTAASCRSAPVEKADIVTAQADRVRWLLDLVQDDTLTLFNTAKDRPVELALLDISKVLEQAGAAIERRHERFLQGSGHE